MYDRILFCSVCLLSVCIVRWSEFSAWTVVQVVLGDCTDVGDLGGEWAWESEGGEDGVDWTDEIVYLVSVGGGGVECVCVKGL